LQGYPSKGLLQFFISMDDIYGLDHEQQDNNEGFCVRFYEEPNADEAVNDMSFIDEVFDFDYGYSPLYDSHKLSFAIKAEYIGIYNLWHLNGIVPKVREWIKESPENKDELENEATELFSSDFHKIGGYPYFTQSDPREYIDKFKNYILLFQMSGDEKIMWGDAGVGNFFIHPDDLAKKDFSKVMYNWDCG